MKHLLEYYILFFGRNQKQKAYILWIWYAIKSSINGGSQHGSQKDVSEGESVSE